MLHNLDDWPQNICAAQSTPELESLIDNPHAAAIEPDTDVPDETMEQKMKDVSQQVAEDDDHLRKIAKSVEKADRKIAKYDGREHESGGSEDPLQQKKKIGPHDVDEVDAVTRRLSKKP